MIEKLKQILEHSGYSVTKQRLSVFGVLQTPKPQTIAQIVDALEGIVDRASVYRTVTLFEELKIVNRIQIGWKYKLELSEEFSPHHHHITCSNCSRVISFDEPLELDALIGGLAEKYDVLIKNHTLELSGLCSNCR